MLQTLRLQWAARRRLDHFRREGVGNLSHDLRSPLTATTACLKTLENRWAGDIAHEADRKLVGVALRLVQSLGDLARWTSCSTTWRCASPSARSNSAWRCKAPNPAPTRFPSWSLSMCS